MSRRTALGGRSEDYGPPAQNHCAARPMIVPATSGSVSVPRKSRFFLLRPGQGASGGRLWSKRMAHRDFSVLRTCPFLRRTWSASRFVEDPSVSSSAHVDVALDDSRDLCAAGISRLTLERAVDGDRSSECISERSPTKLRGISETITHWSHLRARSLVVQASFLGLRTSSTAGPMPPNLLHNVA